MDIKIDSDIFVIPISLWLLTHYMLNQVSNHIKKSLSQDCLPFLTQYSNFLKNTFFKKKVIIIHEVGNLLN